MRLAQFISRSGFCSRRAASRLIDSGVVTVAGKLAGHLSFVDGTEEVAIAGTVVTLAKQARYVIYNKPVGIDCNCNEDDPDSIINQLTFSPRLFPVGRLDKDSHGLLLLTNDGDLCHRLLAPQFNHPKTYLVTVEPYYGMGNINDEFVLKMSQPITLKQATTKACTVELVGLNQFKITLTQGLNRQIRKMAQVCGYRVVDLQRLTLVNLELGTLALGQWRDLSSAELADLK
ncbi:MAG: pseudouridine synthase [Gammaproteobacteria bacterium]|nr:pseudouridine synthase [Gammaproteobacteria bacterium]